MPVRIYDIAKKLGIESKEVLAKAKELGIPAARVPSSSLDKITAEYLEQILFQEKGPAPAPAPAAPAPAPAEPAVSHVEFIKPAEPAAPEPKAETPPAPAQPQPAPIIVAAAPAETAAAPVATPPPVQETHKTAPAPEEVAAKPPQHPEAAKTEKELVKQPDPVKVTPSASAPAEQSLPEPTAVKPVAEQKETIPAPVKAESTPAPLPSAPAPAPSVVPAPAAQRAVSAPVPAATSTEPAPQAAPKPAQRMLVSTAFFTPLPPVPKQVQPAPPAPADAGKKAVQPAPDPSGPPRVGDKVGFIQLPVKAAPKAPEKAGAAKAPAKMPDRAAEPARGKQDPRQQQHPRHGAQQQHGKFQQGQQQRPAGGPGHQFRPPPGKTPANFAEKKFVPPASGEIITMKPPIVVRLLADMLKRKPFQLIADLMELGVFANVNQTIEESVAQKLCAKHGFRFEVEKREKGGGLVHAPIRKTEVDLDDKPEDLRLRPPVVTIMGHVDHGKTSLLDVIRKSNVVAGEAGGITQHIGAYTISFPHPERPKDIQQITFLDTPGHAAFSAMRARGANVTDIVVLVVAANDGVMPQTVEAINHALAAKVPIIVAVNKCDHPNATPMKVRQQLQEHNLLCEEWGGTTIFQDLSALTKQGVDKLLELILLQAEIMELKANPTRRAKGNVIESGLEPGGPTATVLVRKGTLHVGDIIICGQYFGKARALINEEGKRLKEAGPSVAVKLLGLNGIPEAGLEFSVVENEKTAREIGSQRTEEARARGTEDRQKITLENLFENLSDSIKLLKVVVKGDTQGSVEAIVEALKKIESTKVTLEIIHSAVGIITESDVLLASASKAIIIGFHTRIDSGAAEASKREAIQIKLYSIIYELIDEVKLAMAGLLEPISREVVLGSAEVRQVFSLSKGGTVAGCMVTNGRVVRGRCRVLRRKDLLFEGATSSIRRFQDETSEVRAGLECGIRVDGFTEFQTGDIIECYNIEKIAQKL